MKEKSFPLVLRSFERKRRGVKEKRSEKRKKYFLFLQTGIHTVTRLKLEEKKVNRKINKGFQ